MAMAPTIFKKGGTVTPLNSCPLNDAGASCLVMSEQAAKDRGITPQARLLGYAYAGCDPKMMGLGPVPATQKLLKKLGLRLDQIDLIEINEAFAAQVLACQRELDYDPARANVSGGAIALGHPIGATGLRLTATLIHAMARLNARLGLVTLCIGGGQGAAAIFERWEA
jgi:acetyl-CoA C-acetyltransferase